MTKDETATKEPTDWEIVQAMERFGGSFVRALAVLCHRADPQNLLKIKAAWPEFWKEYAEMAVTVRSRDEDGGQR